MSATLTTDAEIITNGLDAIERIAATFDPNAALGTPAYEAARTPRKVIAEYLIDMGYALERMGILSKLIVPGLTLGHLPQDMIIGRLRTLLARFEFGGGL